jgi:RNA polymerase sigma-70 factor (ECF subfamily)
MTNNGHISKAEWIRNALERYEGPLIRYAAQVTGDVECARDVVQDTFLKLCEQEPDEIEDYLAEWLFTVCRNRALDVQRKDGRMRPLAERELELYSSSDLPPDKVIELKESAHELLKLIETLPQRQQEIVRLKFQNGLSYAEISRVTNLTVSNVGFILHRAIQALRRQLKSDSGINAHRLTSYEN